MLNATIINANLSRRDTGSIRKDKRTTILRQSIDMKQQLQTSSGGAFRSRGLRKAILHQVGVNSIKLYTFLDYSINLDQKDDIS